MCYWENKGKYEQIANELFDKFVPSEGKANTVAGELLRAANRIYYDAYNNGFFNNTSGPWKYIKKTISASEDDEYNKFSKAMLRLKKCVNTGGYTEFDSRGVISEALETMLDYVIVYILRNADLQEKENSTDMFDLQDETYFNWEEQE